MFTIALDRKVFLCLLSTGRTEGSAAAVSEPALYRLLTFQVQNLMSLFHCLGRTKVSVQVRGFVNIL